MTSTAELLEPVLRRIAELEYAKGRAESRAESLQRELVDAKRTIEELQQIVFRNVGG